MNTAPMKTEPAPRHALWNREYETRILDQYGDAQDVHHFKTEREAVQFARKEVQAGALAAVVEFHETRYKSARADRSSTYKEVVAFGDAAAIREFGWEGEITPA